MCTAGEGPVFPRQGATGIIAVAPWRSGREWHLCAHVFVCVCVTGIFAATHLGLVGCAAGRQDFWREAQSSLRGNKKTEKHCNSKKAFTGV